MTHTKAYNIGYQDGKNNIVYSLGNEWAENEVVAYNNGWKRGREVGKVWEERNNSLLIQKELFNAND